MKLISNYVYLNLIISYMYVWLSGYPLCWKDTKLFFHLTYLKSAHIFQMFLWKSLYVMDISQKNTTNMFYSIFITSFSFHRILKLFYLCLDVINSSLILLLIIAILLPYYLRYKSFWFQKLLEIWYLWKRTQSDIFICHTKLNRKFNPTQICWQIKR